MSPVPTYYNMVAISFGFRGLAVWVLRFGLGGLELRRYYIRLYMIVFIHRGTAI